MCVCFCEKKNPASNANNFIVGLTNTRPLSGSNVALRSYWLCGQYPGSVGLSQTVSMFCARNLPPARYVIVQFPSRSYMSFCELEVFTLGSELFDIQHYLIFGRLYVLLLCFFSLLIYFYSTVGVFFLATMVCTIQCAARAH